MAYYSPLSLGELNDLIKLKEGWLAGNQSAVKALTQQYKDQGRLPANASDADLSSCLSARLNMELFPSRPVVSFMLNYFKRPWVVGEIPQRLQASCARVNVACELVVNVDNPQEAHLWAQAVKNTSGFVVPVFSYNLHETRGYNRAARVARGKYVVILQDDFYPPPDGQWVHSMVTIFDAFPRMGVIGFNSYRFCVLKDGNRYQGDLPYVDAQRGGMRWHFAHVADFAPMAVRREAWESTGGLDETVSDRGECGITGDWELCHRMWLDGWQVGFAQMSGHSNDGHEGGTHTSAAAEKCWGRQMALGFHVYNMRYDIKELQDELCHTVRKLNNEHLTLPPNTKCPLRIGPCADGTINTDT